MSDDTTSRREAEEELRRLIQNMDADSIDELINALNEVAKTTSVEKRSVIGDPRMYQYS